MITEIMFMIQVCLITGYQTTARKTNNFVLTRFQVLPTLRMVLISPWANPDFGTNSRDKG